MSLAKLLNQPLALHKNSTAVKDVYGNTVASDLGSPVTVYGYLEQAESVETLADRDVVVSGWVLYLPEGTDVNAYDRIGFNGQIFEVDGSPWQVYNPRVGSVSHVQAKLKVVE